MKRTLPAPRYRRLTPEERRAHEEWEKDSAAGRTSKSDEKKSKKK